MSDTEATVAGAQTPTSQKKSGKKASATATTSKKPRAKPSHPKTADMVNAAIKGLKERGGSSLQAIKKYISANYKVDAEKMAPFIRKYLKSAVTSGSLVQTKGKGASGSFKLASVSSGEKKVAKKPSESKPAKPKVAAKTKKEKAAAKKPSSAKKTSSKKTPSSPKKVASKTKPAASKTKTVSRSPTKKPKAPKPKKATATKPKSPKKAASKKK